MDGILLVNKNSGMTSRDVVNKVSNILGIKKIGHTGTLDPMATGVLVLCLGKATKISELITSYDKEYIAQITLGIETDTLDIEGNVLREEKVSNISKEMIEEVLDSFVGKSSQEVPLYSAVKVKGRKLYEYARKGIKVDLPNKDIEIYSLELIDDIKYENEKVYFSIKCHVSKGTYIRSLIRDICYKLKTIGCMSALKRIKQGSFKIEDCYTLKDIENNNYQIIDIKDVLSDIEEITVDYELESKIKNGNIIYKTFRGDIVKIVNSNGEFYCSLSNI